jgi:hypothetical protein
MWGNTNDGQPFNSFAPLYSNIKAGVNYFNDAAMPGYTPYTYPHPLTKGNSQHNTAKKRQAWGGKKLESKRGKKAKEKSRGEMAEGQTTSRE